MSHINGLAAAIRASTESETFDLGGQSVSTIANTIQAAFAEPFPLESNDNSKTIKMIRLTFVTGAGKLARQKYDPDAAKTVTNTLRDLGYQEDRAASCVVECAGSFKLQHDTGKNLKTVVVFPKIVSTSPTLNGVQETTNGARGNDDFARDHRQQIDSPILLEGSPEHLIATSSISVFQRMLSTKCPSWSQKKGCAGALEVLQSQLAAMDSKLVTGTPLQRHEQEFYDVVSFLDDKEDYVRTEMHHQVERGQITSWELEMLLRSNTERITALQQDKNTKKVQLEKALERKKLLSNMIPIEPHSLRHEVAIRKLRKELLPFIQLEEQLKGRLRSVKETQMMARKEEIEHEIARLEEDSRGWFEDADAFQSRLAASRAVFASTHAKPKVKKVTPITTGGSNVSNTGGANQTWVLPGDSKKGWQSSQSGTLAKKKNKSKSGTVFSAMMIDDDDNEDQDDHNVGPKTINNQSRIQDKPIDSPTTSAESKKLQGTGSKKKKGKKQDIYQQTEESALNQAFKKEQKAKQKREEEEANKKKVAHPMIAFTRDYVAPLLLAVLTWLVSLVFGKPKKRKEKDR